jgi:hypothetical protein
VTPSEAGQELRRKLSLVFKAIGPAIKQELNADAGLLMGRVQVKWYTKSKGSNGDGVSRRTGKASRSWSKNVIHNTESNTFTIVLSNSAPYADFSEEREVVPKNAGALAIPIGKALTPAGAHRFTGPRDTNIPDKLEMIVGKRNTILASRKKRADGRSKNVYYVLKDKVVVPAYTSGMMGDLERYWGKMSTSFEDRVLQQVANSLGE